MSGEISVQVISGQCDPPSGYAADPKFDLKRQVARLGEDGQEAVDNN